MIEKSFSLTIGGVERQTTTPNWSLLNNAAPHWLKVRTRIPLIKLIAVYLTMHISYFRKRKSSAPRG